MASARRISDRVAMLYKGKIIWVGATAEIDSSGNPYVDQFIHGRADGPIQMQVRDLCGAAALPVLPIRCCHRTRPFRLLFSSPSAFSRGSRRSEERRVGKGCVRTCRSRVSPYHYKKKRT